MWIAAPSAVLPSGCDERVPRASKCTRKGATPVIEVAPSTTLVVRRTPAVSTYSTTSDGVRPSGGATTSRPTAVSLSGLTVASTGGALSVVVASASPDASAPGEGGVEQPTTAAPTTVRLPR